MPCRSVLVSRRHAQGRFPEEAVALLLACDGQRTVSQLLEARLARSLPLRIEQTIYVERESQRPIILGKGGQTLRSKWSEGPRTMMGLMTAGFPNLFMITGPGSPSVLANLFLMNEYHVDWVGDLNDRVRRDYLDRAGFEQMIAVIGGAAPFLQRRWFDTNGRGGP